MQLASGTLASSLGTRQCHLHTSCRCERSGAPGSMGLCGFSVYSRNRDYEWRGRKVWSGVSKAVVSSDVVVVHGILSPAEDVLLGTIVECRGIAAGS